MSSRPSTPRFLRTTDPGTRGPLIAFIIVMEMPPPEFPPAGCECRGLRFHATVVRNRHDLPEARQSRRMRLMQLFGSTFMSLTTEGGASVRS